MYLSYISDYHYVKASFLFSGTNEIESGYHRFRDDYRIISKGRLWVGLKRQYNDNFLQIEICKSSKDGICILFAFDFKSVDNNEEERTPMF